MDLDLQTNIDGGFTVSFGSSPKTVSGNRYLLNRFEQVFMTNARVMLEGGQPIVDNFGGNAAQFVDQPQVLNNPRNIALGVATAIDQTVQSILGDQSDNSRPNTEKLSTASLLSLSIVNGVIVVSILVVPVEKETYDDLVFNLPITTYGA